MESLETFLKHQKKAEYLLELCQDNEIREKLDRIYKIGIRFNLRNVEIVYLLNEVSKIIDFDTSKIDITTIFK